jgi:hypothetical protein
VGFVSEEAKEGETSREEPVPAADASPTLPDVPEEPRSKAFKMERKREKRKLALFKRFSGRWPTAMRVDALCLLAAILGIMSLGLPWIHDFSVHDEDYFTLWHYLYGDSAADVIVFGFAVGCMLLGSILAFFSRIGGVVQLAGLISFCTISLSSGSGYAIGFYLGVVACALGIASLILRRTFPLPERLRTICRSSRDGTMTLNALSIIGGALGVLCLFLPWFHADYTYDHDRLLTYDYSLIQFGGSFLATPLTTVAALCFMAGSITSILTPLGFVGQLAGVSTFLYAMKDNSAYADLYRSPGYYGYSPSVESSFAIGLYLGLACLLMVFGSILVRWRLKLSSTRATYVLSWPSQPSTPLLAAVSADKKTVPWRGITPVLTQSIRMMFVAVVVLVLAIASAGLAYAMPWSDLEITISNSDADSRVHFEVYIDGEGKAVDYISPATYYFRSFDIRAGNHRIALDYGFPDDAQGTDVDGIIDWSTSVKVKPLRLSVAIVDLGLAYSERPVIALSTSEYGNGWRLSVTSVNDDIQDYSPLLWSDMRTMLHDGNSTVSWHTESTYLYNGTYSEQVFSPLLIGDVTVTCSIVDLAGNGHINFGDFILITSGTNHTFSSSVTYSLYMLYQPTGSLASEVELQGRY